MCQYEHVAGHVNGVRTDAGTPSGLLAFEPIYYFGNHSVALGAQRGDNGEEHAVLVDGKPVGGWRPGKPTPEDMRAVAVDDRGRVTFREEVVATLTLA